MSSFKGLIAVLGITLFAGIGGLYALEELCERQRRIREREDADHNDMRQVQGKPLSATEKKEVVDYMVTMEDPQEVLETQEYERQNGNIARSVDKHPLDKNDVIFDFQEVSDEDVKA